MQVSSYLIIPLIASRRENELPCAVRGKKTGLECMRRRKREAGKSWRVTLP